MSEDHSWEKWEEKRVEYISNLNEKNMWEKIKPFIPLATLALISAIVIFWAVMTTIKIQIITSNIAEDRNVIQQIVTFIQNTQKVGTQNNQIK